MTEWKRTPRKVIPRGCEPTARMKGSESVMREEAPQAGEEGWQVWEMAVILPVSSLRVT